VNKQEREEVRQLLSSPQKIVITTHYKPDADALGSSLAMYNYLVKKGHDVIVVTPSDYPWFLNWMTGNEKVLVFDPEKERSRLNATKVFEQADVVFCLDFSVIDRVQDLKDILASAPGIKILLDHHLEPQHFAKYELWDTKAAATAELVYDFILMMGDESLLDVQIAECIYAGIMTDTGSFRFSSTSAKVHLIIAELIKIGVDNFKIHSLVYDNNSEDRLRFTGYALSEKLRIMRKQKTAYFAISKEELTKFHSKTGDTEGLVNYALSIEGINFAALIIERPDSVKLSFRSRGDFSVNEFSRKYFEGGGHRNAAGGKSNLSLEETEKKFLDIMKHTSIS
jgi:bifunctional oligoribonuclease and PAP phosphatase NrnA